MRTMRFLVLGNHVATGITWLLLGVALALAVTTPDENYWPSAAFVAVVAIAATWMDVRHHWRMMARRDVTLGHLQALRAMLRDDGPPKKGITWGEGRR
jgi:hypothetical protein